jgi:hypothetical protein
MSSSIRIIAICVISLLSVLPVRSQIRTLDGLPGIPFGATGDQVRTEMAKQKGVISTSPSRSYLSFKGGQFAGSDVKRWQFIADEGQFSEALIIFDTLNATPLDTWHHLRRMLVEHYGQPERETFLVILSPFPGSPPDIPLNLPHIYDTAVTYWTIPSSTSTIPNTIRLYLYSQPDGSMDVELSYNCTAIIAANEQRRKEREKPRTTTITVEAVFCGPRRSVQMIELDDETTETSVDPGLE